MGDRFRPPKPKGSKHIATPHETGSTEQLTPVFCLRFLQKGFRLSDCDDDEAVAFSSKLYELCQLTWSRINSTSRDGQGTETITTDQIRAPLPTNRVTAEVERLLSFKFGGRSRMLGLRDGRIFEVYLIDPKGEAYKH